MSGEGALSVYLLKKLASFVKDFFFSGLITIHANVNAKMLDTFIALGIFQRFI